jgi:hypothetical protein
VAEATDAGTWESTVGRGLWSNRHRSRLASTSSRGLRDRARIGSGKFMRRYRRRFMVEASLRRARVQRAVSAPRSGSPGGPRPAVRPSPLVRATSSASGVTQRDASGDVMVPTTRWTQSVRGPPAVTPRPPEPCQGTPAGLPSATTANAGSSTSWYRPHVATAGRATSEATGRQRTPDRLVPTSRHPGRRAASVGTDVTSLRRAASEQPAASGHRTKVGTDVTSR